MSNDIQAFILRFRSIGLQIDEQLFVACDQENLIIFFKSIEDKYQELNKKLKRKGKLPASHISFENQSQDDFAEERKRLEQVEKNHHEQISKLNSVLKIYQKNFQNQQNVVQTQEVKIQTLSNQIDSLQSSLFQLQSQVGSDPRYNQQTEMKTHQIDSHECLKTNDTSSVQQDQESVLWSNKPGQECLRSSQEKVNMAHPQSNFTQVMNMEAEINFVVSDLVGKQCQEENDLYEPKKYLDIVKEENNRLRLMLEQVIMAVGTLLSNEDGIFSSAIQILSFDTHIEPLVQNLIDQIQDLTPLIQTRYLNNEKVLRKYFQDIISHYETVIECYDKLFSQFMVLPSFVKNYQSLDHSKNFNSIRLDVLMKNEQEQFETLREQEEQLRQNKELIQSCLEQFHKQLIQRQEEIQPLASKRIEMENQFKQF